MKKIVSLTFAVFAAAIWPSWAVSAVSPLENTYEADRVEAIGLMSAVEDDVQIQNHTSQLSARYGDFAAKLIAYLQREAMRVREANHEVIAGNDRATLGEDESDYFAGLIATVGALKDPRSFDVLTLPEVAHSGNAAISGIADLIPLSIERVPALYFQGDERQKFVMALVMARMVERASVLSITEREKLFEAAASVFKDGAKPDAERRQRGAPTSCKRRDCADLSLRTITARGLGFVPTHEAQATLEQMLKDPVESVRKEAKSSLMRLNAGSNLPR